MKIRMTENEKAVVEAVERHNVHCAKVGGMIFDVKCGEPVNYDMECLETMRSGNIECGIKLCCKMRELHIDAVVDMLYGYVLPRSEADDSEVDGQRRYLTFEFYEG